MTSIGPSIVITGELVSDEDLTLDGRVVGHVHVRDATLTIGEAARLEADVRGARVIVRGSVKGSIAATERIEVTARAAINGNLSANRIVVEDGAQLNGRIDMDQRTIAAKVAQYKAAQP
jgi:cytoskeletal protein CcmA (bactofilin family)